MTVFELLMTRLVEYDMQSIIASTFRSVN